jgi:hypothetical protein
VQAEKFTPNTILKATNTVFTDLQFSKDSEDGYEQVIKKCLGEVPYVTIVAGKVEVM